MGAAIDSVLMSEWEVVWAQQLWVGREVLMQQFVTQLWSALFTKKKKSVENPGFRELVQAWLLILASSCMLDMTLALQYSFESQKAQCNADMDMGFKAAAFSSAKGW